MGGLELWWKNDAQKNAKMCLTFGCGSGKLCPAPRYGVARKESEPSLLLPPGEAIFQV